MLISEDISLDYRKAVKNSRIVSGKINTTDLPELSASLLQDSEIMVNLSFFAQADEQLAVAVKLEGELLLNCEVCLAPFQFKLNQANRVILTEDASLYRSTSSETDLYLLEGHEFSVFAFVQEEVILSMPYAPAHKNGGCPKRVQKETSVQEEVLADIVE